MGGVALNSTAGGGAGFASTRWNVLIAAAGDMDGPGGLPARAAWEDLYRTYCHPVYAFIRRRGRGRADAQDLTQSFFVHLLEKSTLSRADPGKGRFRTFLLGSLELFLAEAARRERAGKRGGGRHFVFLDDPDAAESEYQLTAPAWETPERLFDARWAAALLRRVFSGLRAEMALAGKAHLFEGLQTYLVGDEAASYQQTADRLGLSLPALKSHVNRLRVRYAARLREEVARTVAPEDVEDEIRHFCAALRRE